MEVIPFFNQFLKLQIFSLTRLTLLFPFYVVTVRTLCPRVIYNYVAFEASLQGQQLLVRMLIFMLQD
jgi:hypothetical protein